MFKYISKRIAMAILTLFIVIIFSYTLLAAFGKNPYEGIEAEYINNARPGDVVLEQIKRDAENYRNTPVLVKLFNYLGGLFKGDFGTLYGKIKGQNAFGQSVVAVFWEYMPNSLFVSLPAFIVSALLGTTLGIVAGYKRGTIWDSIINVFVFIFIAVPSFIIAPMFINLFTKLGFPTTYTAWVRNDSSGVNSFANFFKSIIPPILVVSLSSMAVYTLYARNQTVTVLTSNYVLIAKTKGLSTMQIFRKYVFRNISIPLSAIILPSYIGLLSGSIIVERFWGVEGTAMILAFAFPNAEINLVMYSIILFTSLRVFTDILVDISFVILDPRIVYGSNSGVNYLHIFKAYLIRKRRLKELFKEQEESTIINEEVNAN
ncbi:ABC transporter permease [Mycoplasmopsis bovis]|uniref:ABC transporter permease n=1 Tax=Mycoplasmopsis bovis TaxID=28903 RepID=UPI003BF758DF